MRAAVHDRYGPPSVVSIREVPVPDYGHDEVLVEVHTTTVNRTDCHYRAASPFPMRFFTGLAHPKPKIWGSEFSGRVVELGDSVTNLAVGDRVFGYVEGRFGAHAEFLTVKADGVITKIPDNRSYIEAAPMTEAMHYAKSNLELVKMTEGTNILIYGASGGIGTAAVQLARLAGANVTAVCGPDGVGLVRSLRPDQVIDYTQTDFTASGDRYDVVFDAWGMLSFRKCVRIMKPRSTFVSTGPGPLLQNLVLPVITRFSQRRVAFRPPRFDRAMLEGFSVQFANGELCAPVDRRFSLDEIVDAYDYVEAGRKLGNVVVQVRSDASGSLPSE